MTNRIDVACVSVTGADLEAIRANIAILFPAGQVVEVRAYSKHSGNPPFGQRFTDHDAAGLKIKELSDSRSQEGIYFTLNSFPADIVFAKPSSTVANSMVTRRIWLFLDFDTVFTRPQPPAEWTVNPDDSPETQKEKKAKIAHHKWQFGNASAAELEASEKAANQIKKFLRSLGWSDPFTFFSGNGHHLLYRISLENTEENTNLVEAVTAGINSVLSSLLLITDAECDTSTTNSARITKAYGSFTMKGENTAERPHRYSGLLERGGEIVTREQLEFFVRLCSLGAGTSSTRGPVPAANAGAGPGYSANSDSPDTANDEKTVSRVIEFLNRFHATDIYGGEPVAHRGDWKGKTGWKINVSCPWTTAFTAKDSFPAPVRNADGSVTPGIARSNVGHSSTDGEPDSTIFIPDLGRWEFHCLHSSCGKYESERGWQGFKFQISRGEKFDFFPGSGNVYFGGLPIYNVEILATDLKGKLLLVCEGEAACVAATSAGVAAIGVPSFGCNPEHVKQVISAAKGKNGARIILAFNDGVKPGGELRNRWRQGLKFKHASELYMPPGVNDLAEYVVKRGADGLRRVLGVI